MLMFNPKVFVCDIDGVMTDGKFYYNSEGKSLKVFGPDDNDALKILSNYMKIHFISGDKRGYGISRKRIHEDMKFNIDLVSTIDRFEWILEKYNPAEVIYMGDGIFDNIVMDKVGYSIAPSNAHPFAKESANYITKFTGGNRAVAETCLHIITKFFKITEKEIIKNIKSKKYKI